MLLSTALMLRYGLGRDDEAWLPEAAVQRAASGHDGNGASVSTCAFGRAVVRHLRTAINDLRDGVNE